ncbi:MAG: hypothetical protein OEM31_05015, partial [Gammaproteobacteria bacterium]|nr:hypothetical protein [Gammaproteobacteria bacterium]
MRFSTDLICWKCGASLATLPLPLSREAECPKCRAYLHCCRLCRFFNPNVAEQCDEDRAEEVRNKEGANFCDWFRPRPDAHHPPGTGKSSAAKAKFDDLFSGASAPDDKAATARDKL